MPSISASVSWTAEITHIQCPSTVAKSGITPFIQSYNSLSNAKDSITVCLKIALCMRGVVGVGTGLWNDISQYDRESLEIGKADVSVFRAGFRPYQRKTAVIYVQRRAV